jgi:hypothetical protein
VHIPSRPLFLIAVLVGVLATAGVATAQKSPVKAPPSKNCARAIINDWYPDGDVDFLYPLDCYQKAIKSLGGDLRVYSSAAEDINRAYRFAKRNRPDPGREPGKTTTATTTRTETQATDTVATATDTTETDFGGTSGGGAGGPGQGGGGTSDDSPAGTSDSSSVPVPLIVLGGLAVLLFAAGGAGYLSRRMRGEAVPDDDPASDP